MPNAAIIGTGHYVPERVVTNEDLSRLMDTSDEWIRERSGILERRWVEEGMSGARLGTKAARRAIDDAGIDKTEIDLIIFATLNPDYFFPGNGPLVEDLLELETTGALDIRNQCTGFVYGVAAADGFIRGGTARTVLVIGCEIQSTGMDISTRGRDTAVLFGDGAGAVIMQATDEDRGVITSSLHSQGRYAEDLCIKLPSARIQNRFNDEGLAAGDHFPSMNGQTVFKHATRRFCEAINEVLKKGGVEVDDVALLIPHQANQRITDLVTQTHEDAPRTRLLKHSQVRKHNRRLNPHRSGRGGSRGQTAARRSARDRCLRFGLYLGSQPDQVVINAAEQPVVRARRPCCFP